ncbi:MAG: hypothetical protein ACPG77_04565 [Nannocystaceae bacterium]
MKRTITITLAATAFIGLTACKGGGGAAASKLIPEQATIIGGMDLGGLMGSSLYKDNKDKMQDEKAKEMMEAAKGCNIDIEKLGSVVFGTDGGENVAFVITGAGIGEEANIDCIGKKIEEKDGKAPWTKDGKTLTLDEGKATAYLVDGKTVAFASKSWAGAVKELVDGKGKAAVDGPNKDLFARADKSKHIWVAGKVPEGMAAMAKGVKDFSGYVHFSGGLQIHAAAGFATAEEASALKDMAAGGLQMAKPMLKQQNLPETLTDDIKIDAKDTVLSVDAKISDEDLKKVSELAKGMM